MPVLRVNNYLDAYRLRAQAEDVHELAGRRDKNFVTEFVNSKILEAIQLGPDDSLVDIGCGDAALLRMAKHNKSLGITSTAEEQQKLEAAYPNLTFIAAKAQSLPLATASASKIVCNGTLLLLPSESDVKAALCEMARIAHPGATIWIGEMPEIDEHARYGSYRGTSMCGLLWHILRRNGARSFLGMIRRWMRALLGDERIVLNSAGIFYIAPEKMVALAESCRLKLRSYFRHKEPNVEGEVEESKSTYDYIFTV